MAFVTVIFVGLLWAARYPIPAGDAAIAKTVAKPADTIPSRIENPGDSYKSEGVFKIVRLENDTAAFVVLRKDGTGRDIKTLVEVREGNNGDIRIAVVRRMIAIIRSIEKEDFVWESRRLHLAVTLSARTADNAVLEDFMMQEFFTDSRQSKPRP